MMWRVALLSIAAPLLAQQQNVDLVLVLDATPGMQRSLSVAFFRPDPADRVAVLAVTSKSRLAQSFTNDRQKLTAAIEGLGRRSAVPVSLGMAPSPSEPKIRLFRALLDAARLFQSLPVVPGRHRVIPVIRVRVADRREDHGEVGGLWLSQRHGTLGMRGRMDCGHQSFRKVRAAIGPVQPPSG